MTPVTRWFTETEEQELLDGPFRSKVHAVRAAAVHHKMYKYTPVIAEHIMDADSFAKLDEFNEYYAY